MSLKQTNFNCNEFIGKLNELQITKRCLTIIAWENLNIKSLYEHYM